MKSKSVKKEKKAKEKASRKPAAAVKNVKAGEAGPGHQAQNSHGCHSRCRSLPSAFSSPTSCIPKRSWCSCRSCIRRTPGSPSSSAAPGSGLPALPEWDQAIVGQALKPGYEVKTEPDSQMDIRFHDDMAVRVSDNSIVKIDALTVQEPEPVYRTGLPCTGSSRSCSKITAYR